MGNTKMTRDDAELKVALGVKLTSVEVPELQTALKREIASGTLTIEFDMTNTMTLDSTGIGLLVAAGNSLAAVQGSLRLINVSADIYKLLRSMRLADRLHATPKEG